jgi:hypothetical protein
MILKDLKIVVDLSRLTANIGHNLLSTIIGSYDIQPQSQVPC